MRGSMFSLFSSSQLEYARCRGKALVFRRPGLPAFCGAHFLAASSGPIFTFVTPWAGMQRTRALTEWGRRCNGVFLSSGEMLVLRATGQSPRVQQLSSNLPPTVRESTPRAQASLR